MAITLNRRQLFGVAGLALLLAACSAGANTQANMPDPTGDVAGFWQGLWHGIIAPITFVISLFDDDVGIYEVHNNGNWYDFGFMLGIGAFLGSGGSAAVSGSRGRR